MELIDRAEERRRTSLATLDQDGQSAMGQFFTPGLAAQIIAAAPRIPKDGRLRVLDPGAGSGILTAAVVDRLHRESPGVAIDVTAVELDESLHATLSETLADCERVGATTRLISGDFVAWAMHTTDRFDLVIQNPPYRKLQSGSSTHTALRSVGIDVPNVYAAFLALGLRLVVYQPSRNWLFLMEAASSHGPVDAKRHGELAKLFGESTAGLVYVSCFPDRGTMRKFLTELAWETEAWCASDPTHMIHLNGDKFLGPYDDGSSSESGSATSAR